MRFQNLLLIVFFCLGGCATAANPVADGFHASVPKTGTTVAVLGTYAVSEATATGWLHERGYRIVERAKIGKVTEEQAFQLQHADERTLMLHVGRLIGADIILVVDSSVNKYTNPTPLVSANYGGGSGGGFLGGFAQGMAQGTAMRAMRDAGDWYNASVSVRGIAIESGEVVFTGAAHYLKPQRIPEPMLRNLTCHALATAFGLREPGHLPISDESACHPGLPR